MVGEAGDDEFVARDLRHVDRNAEHLELTGIEQPIVGKDIDEGAVKFRRQAGGVVVPIKDVEGRRRIAHQIVVGPVAPNQVIRPHPRKHAAHLVSLQDPSAHRLQFGRSNHLRSGKQPKLRVRIAAERRHHQRHRVDQRLAPRREHGCQDGRGHRAGAGGVHDDVGRARDVRDSLDGLADGRDVGLHVPIALRGGRIAPADGEHLELVLRKVFDDAAARRQVEKVELVDLRRDDQVRPRVNRIGRGGILDQLEHGGRQHHGTF